MKITIASICTGIMLMTSVVNATEISYNGSTYNADTVNRDNTLYVFAEYNTGDKKAEEITIDGKQYVSLRELAGLNNKSVEWNSVDKSIVISDISDNFIYRLNAQMPVYKNYVFSPFCVKTALAMLANGAEGETRDEILKEINVENIDEYNAYAKYLSEQYDKNEDVKIKTASSVWVNDVIFDEDIDLVFADTVRNCYNGIVEKVSMEEAQDKINKWVSAATEGEFNSVPVDDKFDMNLINTVFFKGEWDNRFSSYSIHDDIFHNSDGSQSMTEYMSDLGEYRYYKDKDVSLIALDYKDKKTSMYVAMTDNANIVLDDYIDKMKYNGIVTLIMPKFEMENYIDMRAPLMNMGIKRAFMPDADFTGMLAGRYSSVMNMLHGSKIKVAEWGTVAAAMAITETGTLDEMELTEIIINKPFTYFIRDDANGEILFMGRCNYLGK